MGNIDEAECNLLLRGGVKCLTRQEQLLVLVPDSYLSWFRVTLLYKYINDLKLINF